MRRSMLHHVNLKLFDKFELDGLTPNLEGIDREGAVL